MLPIKGNNSLQHITNGCRILAGAEYTARHNNAAKVIHQALATKYKPTENTNPYYKYTLTSVLENNQFKLHDDIEINTDKTNSANRLDIIYQSKAGNITYIIDIAIPNEKKHSR